MTSRCLESATDRYVSRMWKSLVLIAVRCSVLAWTVAAYYKMHGFFDLACFES